MDEVDKKIVKILKNNSKTTLQNISEKICLLYTSDAADEP